MSEDCECPGVTHIVWQVKDAHNLGGLCKTCGGAISSEYLLGCLYGWMLARDFAELNE